MTRRQWIPFVCIVLCSLRRHDVNASKILAIFPSDAKSHYMMYGAVMRELAKRGHEITVASIFPEDLDKFFNESKEGVILFSLGSFVPAETITEDKMKVLLDIFRSLPYNILWKISGTLEIEFPPNVKISKWIPQLSVLCDPRTKLFISHGGLLGMQEAMHCGVPILGIPLFADQYMNIKGIQEKGAAMMLYYDDINVNSLTSNINKLLYDDTYRDKAKFLSTLFKDRPQHPLDSAVYWIEYVIRYNGAPHLRSPGQDLSWYQYLLLDVFAITIIVPLGTLYLVFIYLFKFVKKCNVSKEYDLDKKNS